MIVYFVRHGQSEGNKQSCYQSLEIPLSEEGIKQAESLAKRLENIHFDLIYSSGISRAQQTAEILNKKIKAPIEIWEDLRERRSPTEVVGKSIYDKETMKIRDLINKNSHNGNFRYSDEETFNELIKRAGDVIKHLEEKHKGQTILCVSHATAIKAVVGKIIFGDKFTSEMLEVIRHKVWLENTGITICEKSKEYGWQVTTLNDRLHV